MLETLLSYTREWLSNANELQDETLAREAELEDQIPPDPDGVRGSDTLELMIASRDLLEEIESHSFSLKETLEELLKILEGHRVEDPFADDYRDYLNGEGRWSGLYHSD